MEQLKQFNIDKSWLEHADVDVSINKKAAEKSEDAKLRRFKEAVIFAAAILAVAYVFFYSSYRLFHNPNDTWAMGSLTSIMGVLVGYITGKKSI